MKEISQKNGFYRKKALERLCRPKTRFQKRKTSLFMKCLGRLCSSKARIQKGRWLNQKGRWLNQKGQTLVEYLILVALMSVAAIGIVRSLNQTVNAKFATITYALQGSKKRKAPVDTVKEEYFRKKDLSDFMNGAASQKEK